MRAYIIALLLLLISIYTHAQDNRVSLRINEFAWYKIKASSNDTLSSSNDMLKQMLPTIGFYHTFKNNVGTITKEYRLYKNNALIQQSKEAIKYEAYTVFSLGTRISFSLQYHFNNSKKKQ